jgi:uncharacterized protein
MMPETQPQAAAPDGFARYLLVRQPAGTTISSLNRIRTLFERILGRSVDVMTYGGLKAVIDDDIRREAVLL